MAITSPGEVPVRLIARHAQIEVVKTLYHGEKTVVKVTPVTVAYDDDGLPQSPFVVMAESWLEASGGLLEITRALKDMPVTPVPERFQMQLDALAVKATEPARRVEFVPSPHEQTMLALLRRALVPYYEMSVSDRKALELDIAECIAMVDA